MVYYINSDICITELLLFSKRQVCDWCCRSHIWGTWLISSNQSKQSSQSKAAEASFASHRQTSDMPPAVHENGLHCFGARLLPKSALIAFYRSVEKMNHGEGGCAHGSVTTTLERCLLSPSCAFWVRLILADEKLLLLIPFLSAILFLWTQMCIGRQGSRLVKNSLERSFFPAATIRNTAENLLCANRTSL